MARLPRLVIPGQPMHIVQRGNNRQATFYAEEDYRFYLEAVEKKIKGSEYLKIAKELQDGEISDQGVRVLESRALFIKIIKDQGV